MSHFSIAGLQLSLSAGDNLSRLAREIAKTKERFPWIDMIVLSELAAFGPEKKYAKSMPGITEEFFCQIAKNNNVWLIPGSLYEQSQEKIYNTTPIINPEGTIVKRYRKIYPFFPYEEGVSEGDEFVVFDVPGGKIGIAICYDLWFPEVARTLAVKGADVIIYPTLTGTIDRPLELVMAQSTAAMNQCYVMTVNASFPLGNGQSNAVDPTGKVIYQAGEVEQIMPIEIDFSLVTRTRTRGVHGLGQPLKSFRDNPIAFDIYQEETTEKSQLDHYGKLEIPK